MKLKLSHTCFRMWQTRLDVKEEPERSFLGGGGTQNYASGHSPCSSKRGQQGSLATESDIVKNEAVASCCETNIPKTHL